MSKKRSRENNDSDRDEHSEYDLCPICLEDIVHSSFNTNDSCRFRCCRRLFHSTCVWKWLTINKSCPTCRKENPECQHDMQDHSKSTLMTIIECQQIEIDRLNERNSSSSFGADEFPGLIFIFQIPQ